MGTQEKNIDPNIGNADISASESSGYKQELKRVLTLKDLIVFGLIIMLTIAPCEVYGSVAMSANGMAPLVYLVGIIAMVFTALSYSRMSNEFPIAGSIYSYVQRGINPHLGFVIGWTVTMDYILVPALLCGFAGIWLHSMLPILPSYVYILIFLFINTFINYRGIEMTAKANQIMLVFELAVIALFIIFGIKYVFIDGLGAGGFSLAPFYQPGKVDFSFIATATSIAVLGYIGFDSISTLSEEVKNPRKTIGKATLLSLLLIGVLFMGQSYMAALIHPAYTDLNPDMAWFDIAKEAGGVFLYYAWLVVAIIAVGIANTLAIQSSVARLLFAMARDNTIPGAKLLCKVHPKYKTPYIALLFTAIVTIGVALLPIMILITLVNFGALTAFMMINLTVLVHFFIRKKIRGLKGFLKYFVTPAVGFLIVLYVWLGLSPLTFILGFSWMSVGIIIGAVKSKGYKQLPPALEE